jgi:hypothetical protein
VEIVSKRPFSETGEDHLVLLERQRLRERVRSSFQANASSKSSSARLLLELSEGGVQVFPFALIFPAEALAHVGPTFAASALGGAFFETVPLTGRVGIRRIRFLEHPAQVIEMRLRSRSLLPARPPSISLQIHLAIKSSSLPLPAAVHCPIQAAPRARNLLGKRPLLPDPDRFSRARALPPGRGTVGRTGAGPVLSSRANGRRATGWSVESAPSYRLSP